MNRINKTLQHYFVCPRQFSETEIRSSPCGKTNRRLMLRMFNTTLSFVYAARKSVQLFSNYSNFKLRYSSDTGF